jgi:hypothetical protein
MGNTGGLIAEWYVEEGSSVQSGQPVFRMESDFVSLDIEADAAGVLRHVVPAGIPQFEGGIVGFVLAPGERMPKVEGLDDWDEETPDDDWEQDPAAAVFTGGAAAQGFGQGSEDFEPAGNEPILLRPRRRTDVPDDEKPGLWEQVTDEKLEPGMAGLTSQPAFHPLVMRVAVPMTEAAKVRAQLAEEWQDESLVVTDEVMVVRAIGHVLEERPRLERFKSAVDLVLLTPDGSTVYSASRPGKGSFHDVAKALQQPAAEAGAKVAVVSYIAFAIDSAEPRLTAGRAMVIAVARPVVTTAVTLTLVYDAEQVDDHDAAAFLGRVRTLLVQPYALLAE